MDNKYRKEMANELSAIRGEDFAYVQVEPTTSNVSVDGAMPVLATITTNASYPPVIGNPAVGPKSTELNCPQCRCRIKTKVRHRSTTRTHIACLLMSATLCCCCLPYCMDSCRNANHFCPMCGAFVGSYQS